jgi:hypothetical protein
MSFCGTRNANQHHSVGALGLGEQHVTMVDTAVEHPSTAGSAEALSTRIRWPDIGPLQRR